MGFLKKLLIFFALLILVFCGCSTTGIKIIKSDQQNIHSMFGKVPAREFYSPVQMSDSLKLLWESEANGSFTQSSVTYFGDNLFVNDLSGRIYCFDVNNGKVLGQLRHKNPIYTTPLVNRYYLFYIESFSSEDKSILRVFHLLESRSIAEKEIRGRVRSEMLMIERDVYFVTDRGILYKFNPMGEQIWMVELRSNIRSSPVSDGKVIYIGTDQGEILVIEPSEGKVMRKFMVGSIISSGLTLTGDHLLFGMRNGDVYSINKDEGKVNWKYESGSSVNAVPVATNEKVYIVNLGGDIISLDLMSGKEYWRTITDGVLNVTPLLTDNYLIIPDLSNRILFTDIKDGRERKTIELPNRAKLSPVIYNNLLIIGFDRGVIRAYEII
jgi:outer membrane protein assembly factor BamB